MNLRYGKADENVLKRSVEDVILHERQKYEANAQKHRYSPVSNESPVSTGFQKMSGSQEKSMSGKTALCAVTFGSSCIGELAVIRAVNSLAADGIRARVFSPLILLPPGTQEEQLREIMRQICSAAFPLNVEVQTGRIEVTDAVKRPVITGSAFGTPFSSENLSGYSLDNSSENRSKDTSGYSSENLSKKSSQYSHENAFGRDAAKNTVLKKNKSEGNGREIVAAGWIGMEGTYILTLDRSEQLRERFPATMLSRMNYLREELSVLRAAETAAAEGARTMVNLADGGLMTGLWELSKKTGCGMDIDLKKVPVLQETIEISEFFEINPYLMKSEGCLLAVVEDADRLSKRLMNAGIFAVRIGHLNDTKDKIIRNGEEIRHLDRPQTDSLAEYFSS